MENTDFAVSFFRAVGEQDGSKLNSFFARGAEVYWHNTNELFTAEEFIRATCEYPGKWSAEVERTDGGEREFAAVAKVWTADCSFRTVSFFELSGGKIKRLDEYWGDIDCPPQWRADMKIGRKIVERKNA